MIKVNLFVKGIKRRKYDKKEDETNLLNIIIMHAPKIFQEENKTTYNHGEIGEFYEDGSAIIIILFLENNNKHSAYNIYDIDHHEYGSRIHVVFNEVTDLEKEFTFNHCHSIKYIFIGKNYWNNNGENAGNELHIRADIFIEKTKNVINKFTYAIIFHVTNNVEHEKIPGSKFVLILKSILNNCVNDFSNNERCYK